MSEDGIERDPTAPEQPQTSDDATVYLPGVIAAEYGIPRSEARQMVLSGTLTIDGEPWVGAAFDLPEDAVMGKTLRLEGDVRTVQFQYVGGQRDRYTGDRFDTL